MRMAKLLPFILVFFAIACSDKKENDKLPDEVVLILQDPPKQVRFTYPSGVMSVRPNPFLIAYVDEDSDAMTYYLPEEGCPVDTLTLRCTQAYKEVLLSYKSKEGYSVLTQKGDTILVAFSSDGYPILKSYTSKHLADAYNFTLSIKDSKVFLGLEALSHIAYSGWLESKINVPNAPAFVKRYENDYLPVDSLNKLFDLYTQNYRLKLDSLSGTANVSHDFVDFYYYVLQLKQWKAYIARLSYDKNLATFNNNPTTEVSINSFFSDQYIGYASYLLFIDSYIMTYIPKAFGIPLIQEANGSYTDHRVSFDTILGLDEFPLQTKNLMLQSCLQQIIQNFSARDLEVYLNKYSATTGDTLTIQRLKQKHKLDFSTSNELMLQDASGHQLSFQSLLDKHKNKVVYVDFWASWCAPCQRAMPDAKKLREEYRDKDVVFVYLAFNDEEKAWRSAMKKFEVDYLSESYIITNPKASQLIVDLEIKSIPRYLLYNKQGELVHKKAPDAKGQEIRNLLNQYLAE